MKYRTLNRNGDFRRAYGRAKPQSGAYIITYATKNRLAYSRYGITTSKKIGNAVQRNRTRRLLKEALRTLDEPFLGNWDIVLVARAKTRTQKMPFLREILRRQLRDSGVTAKRAPSKPPFSPPPKEGKSK
jgi:ribonuclease P protein component